MNEYNIARLVTYDIYIKIDNQIWYRLQEQVAKQIKQPLKNKIIDAITLKYYEMVRNNVFSKVLDLGRKS